jgi:hypothetical protein
VTKSRDSNVIMAIFVLDRLLSSLCMHNQGNNTKYSEPVIMHVVYHIIVAALILCTQINTRQYIYTQQLIEVLIKFVHTLTWIIYYI